MSEEFIPKSAWHYWHNRLWSEIAKICTDYAEWKPGRLSLDRYSVTDIKQRALAKIGVVVPIESECFACAAADGCHTCPVVWKPTGDVLHATCHDSCSAFAVFMRHFRARMYIEAANAAEAVANLPWIVERETTACPLPTPKEVKNGKCYDIVCDCACAAACGGRYYSLDAEGAKHAFMEARDFCPQPKEALSNLTVLGVQELAVGSQSLSEQCAGILKSAHAVLELVRLLELERWHTSAEAVCVSDLYRSTVLHAYDGLLKLQTFLEQRVAKITESEGGE